MKTSKSVFIKSYPDSPNGYYIEDLITGYTTTEVTGRESLETVLDTEDRKWKDGSIYKGKKLNDRILTVYFVIEGGENAVLLSRLNALNDILNGTNLTFIFSDESDKYYIGTKEGKPDVSVGLGVAVGSFTIRCTNPYKFSSHEFEEEATIDNEAAEEVSDDGQIRSKATFDIYYEGSQIAYPRIFVDFYSNPNVEVDAVDDKGSCDYVAFVTSEGSILQMGYPEAEQIIIPEEKPHVMTNQYFKRKTSWDSLQDYWDVNKVNAHHNVPGVLKDSVHMEPCKYEIATGPSSAWIVGYRSSEAQNFTINYDVICQLIHRYETSATIRVTVKAAISPIKTVISAEKGLTANVYINGHKGSAIIKYIGSKWEGKKGISRTFDIKVPGIKKDTTELSVYFEVTGKSDVGLLRKNRLANFKIRAWQTKVPSEYYLTGNRLNSTLPSGAKHGSTISMPFTRTIAGTTHPTNFTFQFSHIFAPTPLWGPDVTGSDMPADGYDEKGEFKAFLLDDQEHIVVGMRISKYAYGRMARVFLYAGGDHSIKYVDVDVCGKKNPFKNFVTTAISKNQNKVLFKIPGVMDYTYTLPEAINPPSTVMFGFFYFENDNRIKYNGLQFEKVNNIGSNGSVLPRTFLTNDVLEIDCETGQAYLNGVRRPDLGALGNDWENFCLLPGLNKIGIAYSDFSKHPECAPKFSIRYREVFV